MLFKSEPKRIMTLVNNNNNFSSERVTETQTLTFPPGLFHGKESGLRITEDKKWVSVFDVIKLVGNQTQPKKTWIDIKNQYPDMVTFCNHIKFKGYKQKETPVVNAKGLVLLLMHIPGEKAKQFRSAGELFKKECKDGVAFMLNKKDI